MPVAFTADIIPESAGAAIAPTQPVRTDETITARVVAESLLGDGGAVIEVAATLGQQKSVFVRAGRAVEDPAQAWDWAWPR
jgi:hypothetical protein